MAGAQRPQQPWQESLYPSHVSPQAFRRERPTGVTVIAVLMMLTGLLLLLGAIAVIAVAFWTSGWGDSGDFFGPLYGLFGVIMLVIGIAYMGLAIGLLRLKPWARSVARVLAVFGLLSALLSVLAGDPTSILSLVFNVIIVWYLGRNEVRAAFEPARAVGYQARRAY